MILPSAIFDEIRSLKGRFIFCRTRPGDRVEFEFVINDYQINFIRNNSNGYINLGISRSKVGHSDSWIVKFDIEKPEEEAIKSLKSLVVISPFEIFYNSNFL